MVLKVVLTSEEMDRAGALGERRQREAPGDPAFSYRSTGRSGDATHILGAQSELAFAKALRLVWPARLNQWKTGLPDVDPNWEVRWTRTLKVKVKAPPKDPPTILVAAVTGSGPAFEVVGYVIAGWVQANRPLDDLGNRGKAAHFIALMDLVPIESGFHSICTWEKMPDQTWRCPFCGALP